MLFIDKVIIYVKFTKLLQALLLFTDKSIHRNCCWSRCLSNT